MIRRHLYILRVLCGPQAYLIAKRRNGQRQVILVHNHAETKCNVTRWSLDQWIAAGYVERSDHGRESYVIADAGRQFVARFDAPDTPLSMESILKAQQAARAALGR